MLPLVSAAVLPTPTASILTDKAKDDDPPSTSDYICFRQHAADVERARQAQGADRGALPAGLQASSDDRSPSVGSVHRAISLTQGIPAGHIRILRSVSRTEEGGDHDRAEAQRAPTSGWELGRRRRTTEPKPRRVLHKAAYHPEDGQRRVVVLAQQVGQHQAGFWVGPRPAGACQLAVRGSARQCASASGRRCVSRRHGKLTACLWVCLQLTNKKLSDMEKQMQDFMASERNKSELIPHSRFGRPSAAQPHPLTAPVHCSLGPT